MIRVSCFKVLGVGTVVGLAMLLSTSSSLYAQKDAVDHTAFNGGWTLNREASGLSATSGLDVPDAGGGGGRRAGGGGGRGGFGGGGGGRRGGGGFGGGRGGADPDAMRQRVELLQEIARPASHLVITQSDGAITFVDEEGHSRRFATAGKKEKHQLSSGTIETKTSWDGASLRQEIDAGGAQSIVRMFTVEPEVHQLVITAGGDRGDRGGRGQRRLVYDADMDAQ